MIRLTMGWQQGHPNVVLHDSRWKLVRSYPRSLPVPMVYLRDPLLRSLPGYLARRRKP